MSAALDELAAAHGVAVEYWDQAGVLRRSSDNAVAAVLRALGADPSDEDSIRASLRERDLRDWRRTLPPVVVAVGGIVEPAQSNRWVDPREVDGQLVGEATFVVPADIPLGWHVIKAYTDEGVHESVLVVTPERLHPPALASAERLWGLMAQIYSVRSRRSWGIGDLADLADLAAWSGHGLGADFVLVNPLHAAAPIVPMTPSPYLPATRRFPNPIYLRIEQIAEFAYLSGGDRKAVRRLGKPVRRLSGELLDRDAVWEAKSQALDIVRRVPLTPGRQARYDAYVESEGPGLIDFATWCALTEEYGPDWSHWPPALSRPDSVEVAEWRASRADRIERHLWMQWLLDEQMERTQEAALEVGMRAGIIHDLAVGVGLEGADAWALQDVLASGVTVGCPPDMYNQLGQNWAQPPWSPDALADAAYTPGAAARPAPTPPTTFPTVPPTTARSVCCCRRTATTCALWSPSRRCCAIACLRGSSRSAAGTPSTPRGGPSRCACWNFGGKTTPRRCAGRMRPSSSRFPKTRWQPRCMPCAR